MQDSQPVEVKAVLTREVGENLIRFFYHKVAFWTSVAFLKSKFQALQAEVTHKTNDFREILIQRIQTGMSHLAILRLTRNCDRILSCEPPRWCRNKWDCKQQGNDSVSEHNNLCLVSDTYVYCCDLTNCMANSQAKHCVHAHLETPRLTSFRTKQLRTASTSVLHNEGSQCECLSLRHSTFDTC